MINIKDLLMATFIAILLMSCSREGDSSENKASGESVYDSGASIAAAGFKETASIELLLREGDGKRVVLQDGYFIEPGLKTIEVEIKADPSIIGRVFLSDGGGYQVEALPQGAYYVCDFLISKEGPYQTILVQAIHHNKRASKKKIVLGVDKPIPDRGYIKNGIGLVVGQDILEDQKDYLGEILDENIKGMFTNVVAQTPTLISKLSYGDNNPYTRDVEVLSLEAAGTSIYPAPALRFRFVIKGVSFSAIPLFNTNFISTQSNDLFFDTYLVIEDRGTLGDVRLAIDFLDSAKVSFSKPFFMQSIAERMMSSEIARIELAPIALNLKDKTEAMKDSPSHYIKINGSDVDVNKLVEGAALNLDKYLFADVYTLPVDSASGILALDIGLFIEDKDNVEWETITSGAQPVPIDTEGVFVGLCESVVREMLNNIRQKYLGLITELSYGDDDTGTKDFIVNSFALQDGDSPGAKNLHMNFTMKKVDLQAVSLFSSLGFSFISTEDNDLMVDAVFSIVNYEDGTEDKTDFDIVSVSYATFEKPFLGKALIEDMIKNDLREMEKVSYDTDDALSGIALNIDLREAMSMGKEYPLFPETDSFIQSPGWLLGLKDKCNIRCAISQYSINHALNEILDKDLERDVKELLIPVLGKKFPGFAAERSNDEETVMSFSVPPVVDLRSSQIKLFIPGIVIEYRLSGIPQWEASIDLDLIITPSVQGKNLNISISPTEGRNHFHIMKDNRGNLGIFDHSSLAEDVIRELPEMLDRSSGEPLISYALGSLEPAFIFEESSVPMSLTAGGGYLVIDMAVLKVDSFEWIEI